MEFDLHKLAHNVLTAALDYGIIRGVLRLAAALATGILVHLSTKLGEDAVLTYLKAHGHIKKG